MPHRFWTRGEKCHTFTTKTSFIIVTKYLQFSTLLDDDGQLGLVACAHRHVLHLPHHQQRLLVDHLAEDHVLAVQPVCLGAGEEELAAVGVGAAVRHGEQARPRVPQDEVLVREGAAVDAVSTRAVAVLEVPPLQHECLDDSVEGAVFVAHIQVALFVLACAELAEVLGRPGTHVCEQLHLDTACGDARDRDVKKHHWVAPRYRFCDGRIHARSAGSSQVLLPQTR
mmetsp:Transcript_27194/g.58559  ORF Transcript_27194/g.58559 Transcript_27194/m.58559 type:complete len:226 (-) Transcript_27194:144-821(-)